MFINLLLLFFKTGAGRVSTNQESLHTSIVMRHLSDRLLTTTRQKAHRIFAHFTESLLVSGIHLTNPRGLDSASKQDKKDDQPGKSSLIHDMLLFAMMAIVESFPVFPGRIGIDCRPIRAPGMRSFGCSAIALRMMTPTGTGLVISGSPCGIRKNLMRSHHDAVPLETNFRTDISTKRMLVAGSIGMIDFYKIVVLSLRIRGIATKVENVIGSKRRARRPLVGVFRRIRGCRVASIRSQW